MPHATMRIIFSLTVLLLPILDVNSYFTAQTKTFRANTSNQSSANYNGVTSLKRNFRVSNRERFTALSMSGLGLIEQLEAFDKPFPNTIPPSDTPDMSKLEIEFYSMMREFGAFTPKDVSSVKDPRYRALYEGVSAGSNEPAVMNAFAVIFSDFMPIRIAGRMIYRHLKGAMDTSIDERDVIETRLVDEIGFDLQTIDHGRQAFLSLMDDDSHDGELTMSALIDSEIVETIIELLQYESFDAFVETMDADEDEKVSFENFMIGLQKCTYGEGEFCDVSCDVSDVLSEVIRRMEPVEAKNKGVSASDRKEKYSDKFDNMVTSFGEWEELVPTGDGRMIDVLRGCFVGAKNDKIVGALKIVYMDYSALRVGGDLVFKLMGKVVKRQQKKAA